MSRRLRLVSSLIFSLGIFASGNSPSPRSAHADDQRFKKVMVVVFENMDYETALKQPGFASLVANGALLTNMWAEAHPSQPNYIALVSGDTHGVRSNDPADLSVRHLGDLLESKGRSWKAYLEDYPGNCFEGERSKDYVRKHNPFISFSNIRSSPARCARLVQSGQLRQDVRNDALPDFSLYIPNLKNDGHDTGPDYASRWLTEQFMPVLSGPLRKDLLLVVTFDESASSRTNRIFTALYGAGVKPGGRADDRYDHYSLLRTIQKRFGLGSLGAKDESAREVTGVWR